MELFTQLFGGLLLFVYHCFDRIVINGYLSGLSRPEQVVHFFRQIIKVPILSKEVLAQRTNDYQNWVEAFARNHNIPIEWAQKGVRKEDQVLPWLRRMRKKGRLWSLFHFQEHGTRANLPHQRAEVSYKGPQPPDPGASAQPLHPLLLLHLRPSAWTDRDAGGFILAIPGHLLPQWPLLHRAGTGKEKGRLPQE